MDVERRPLINMKNKPDPVRRMHSCLATPQETALDAWERKEYKIFIDAISEDGFEPNAEYGDEVPKTLAHMIIEEAVKRDIFLLGLVKQGGRTDLVNPVLEQVPFHEAIRKQDSALLKVCLLGVQDINVQDGEGSTALHVATEGLNGADESETDNLVDILAILLQVPGIDLECEDMKGECTPLYYAATAGCEKAVDLLLSFGANPNNSNSGESIADIIRRNIPGFDLANYRTQRSGRPVKNVLFNLIELADNLEGFKAYTEGRKDIDWNEENGQFTLLQYASDQGRQRLVQYLLEQGANAHSTSKSNRTPALLLAAYHGYYKVLQVFFTHLTDQELKRSMMSTDEYHGKKTILHQIVKQSSPKLDNPYSDTDIDYAECLKLLFDDKKQGAGKASYAKYTQRIINFRDSNGETALHYATQQPNQEIIKLLLKHGANMGVKNNEEKAPVNRILPDTLKEFFDDCIESEGIITDDDLRITFDYGFLAPPLLDAEVLTEFEKSSRDVERSNTMNARPETEALWYMSQSSEHRGLLKHPVISSFLLMKWQRIRTFYILSLITYLAFVFFLTGLVILEYGGCSLIQTNLTMEEVRGQEDDSTVSCRGNTLFWRIMLGVFVICLAIVEFVQLCVSVKRYLASVTNYIQVAILIGTAVLIFDKPGDWEERRHLAALLIVFSWSEFIILVGQHPSLSVNVTMLYTVVSTFFKFLLWYMAFILAFALSFYIMFHTDHSGGEENPEYVFFDKIGTCVVKTSAMFVGELEFSDIPFSNNPISYLLFVAFIFLVVVVLMNLLNGLAVSDTGLIREEAEVLSLKSQVDLISYWESILMNDPYNFLTNWPKFLSALPSCSCCFWVKRIPLCNKVSAGTRILLFYECLPNKSATFYPNSSRAISCIPYRKRIQVEPSVKTKTSTLQVRKDVLDQAKAIILEREKSSELEGMMVEKLTSMEKQIEKLTATLNMFLDKAANKF